MQLAADPSLTPLVYTAQPNTPSSDGLRLLASWAATHDQAPASDERASEHHQA